MEDPTEWMVRARIRAKMQAALYLMSLSPYRDVFPLIPNVKLILQRMTAYPSTHFGDDRGGHMRTPEEILDEMEQLAEYQLMIRGLQ